MAERIEIFTITCPPGTAQSSPQQTDLTIDPGRVDRIDLRIPPGHAFITGIAIASAHQILIPNKGAAWIFGDDDREVYDTESYPDTGSWQAFTFNADTVNAHTWQVKFHVTELEVRRPPRVIRPIPIDRINTLYRERG